MIFVNKSLNFIYLGDGARWMKAKMGVANMCWVPVPHMVKGTTIIEESLAFPSPISTEHPEDPIAIVNELDNASLADASALCRQNIFANNLPHFF